MWRMLRPLLRLSASGVRRSLNTSAVRHGDEPTFLYRSLNSRAPELNQRLSLLVHSLVWGWIFWHVFTEPEHLFGYDYIPPDPTKMTDQELGIPPDE